MQKTNVPPDLQGWQLSILRDSRINPKKETLYTLVKTTRASLGINIFQ